ncbi:MAG: phosphoglycerate kinase, partial [Bacteroidales bacterium]|nr:phosphoglycerate kinase [Bacteroidales bacterium]
EVLFTQSLLGEEVTNMVNGMKEGDVMLLENIRFYKGETDGDMEFAKELAKLGDAYVNNAFGTVHRAHASVALLAELFPNDHYFGFLMEREVENLSYLLGTPKRPFTAIIGGSKISGKIDVLENLISKVDNMIIGGGMRYTFTKALGGKIGNSIHEDDKLDVALDLVDKMKKNNVNLYLPIDCMVIKEFRNDAESMLVPGDQIPDGWEAVDCGPKSIELFREVILKSQTILWNGPMGVFEMPNFAKGTFGVAEAVAEATKNGAFSVAGGGDSISALQQLDMMDKMSFVSTGGGAMLEFLSGIELPGLKHMK